jgi:Gpi18-like mannosyltransferase
MTVLPSPTADDRPAERDVRRWWNLAAGALLLRFLLMPYGGFPSDIGTFKAWAVNLAAAGPAAFYGTGFADYLPGYLYVLWVIGEVHGVVRFNDPAFLFALKLPAVIADLLTAWLIFAYGRRLGSASALVLSASYLFNPGVIFNSALWGQADAVGAAFALAGVMSLGVSSPALAAGLLAIAVLVKPQNVPALLIAGLGLLRVLWRPASGPPRWDLIGTAAATVVATFAVVVVPFGLNPERLLNVLRTSLNVYPYGSVMAFNFWGAAQGFWISDGMRWLGVPLYALGSGAALAILAIVGIRVWRRPDPAGVVLAAAVALLAAFVLPTRIHERYLLPALPFFAAAAASDRRAAWLYGGLSTVFAANVLFAYTRPYAETFLLPGWLEATVLSDVGARLWSALGALSLPAALWTLFNQPGRANEPPQPPAGRNRLTRPHNRANS